MKDVKKRIKELFKKIKKFIIENKSVILMILPFVAIDLITRILTNEINFFKVYRLVPNLFTTCWIILLIGIVLSFKHKVSKILYLFFSVFYLIFYLVINIYYSIMMNIFSFNMLDAVSEGSPYFLDSLVNANKLIYVFFVLIVILVVIGYRNIPKNKKFNKDLLIKTIVIFFVIHTLTPLFLGKANSQLAWNTWKNPRNVYNQYNDNNKSFRVSGFYEYVFRNFYVTYLRRQETNQEEIKFLDEIYSTENEHVENNYTGLYKNKNLIMIQLEGIDSWLLNEEDTPTLYSLRKESINFTDHYSFYNGGGSTFNSEFAVNTGFVVPFSYNQNAYQFNGNSFPYSLANLFKDEGYIVNAFHMNTGEYYSRRINYKNWGYDNYYSLLDMFKYKGEKYTLDRELILNEEYSDKMFPEDKNFVDYIITYSAHLPFTNTKGVCKLLYEIDNAPIENETSEESASESEETKQFVEMTEEECARRQAKETDYMVELLIQKLKEKDLLEDTVIVVFTDHYLYTLEDKTILDKYKETSNNLINKTPFFIWNGGETKVNIKDVTSQLNILPTVLNLFGIEYDPNNYIGTDALGKDYNGLVFFSDYSWYDGHAYVSGGEVTSGSASKETLEETNYYVNLVTKKNDFTLKYNYFKKSK